MPHPKRPQRIHHRIDNRRRRRYRPRLPRPLHPQRIRRRRRNRPRRLKRRQTRRLRHRVIQHAPRYQLPVIVIHPLLAQRLPDTLRHAPVNHPLHDHRVNHIPHIIHRDIPQHLRIPRIRIHLHHADMRPERPREILRIVNARSLQTRLHPLRQPVIPVRRQRHLLERLPLSRRPLHKQPPILVHHILRRRLQQMRRYLPRLILNLLSAHMYRRPPHNRAPAAKRPRPLLHLRRIALHHLHILHRHPQLRRRQLRERRLMPLPMPRRPAVHRHLPRRMHPHQRTLPHTRARPQRVRHRRRSHPADLHIRRQPHAQIPPLLPRRRLLPAELLIPQHPQRLIQPRLIIAAVVNHPRRHLIPILKRRYQILAPNLRRIHPHLRRENIQQPLHDIRRLRPARPPVCVNRRRIREHPYHLAPHIRDLVRPHQHQPEQIRRYRRRESGQISPHIRVHRPLYPRNRPIPIPHYLPIPDMIAPVRRRQIILLPLLNPLHRHPQLLRHHKRDDLLRVQVKLAPEPAPDIRRNHPYLMLRMPRNQRQQQPNQMRNLRRRPHRHMISPRIIIRHNRPPLHRIRNQPLIHNPLRNPHLRALPRSLNIAACNLPLEPHIIRRILMNLRRPLLRSRLRVHRRRQRIIIHSHQRRSVSRHRRIIRNYCSHRIPYAAHLINRQRRMRHLNRIRHHPPARQRPQLLSQLLPREHRRHARHRRRRASIHRPHIRMRVRTPHQRHMQHPH